MKIMIIGKGGREYMLAHTLRASASRPELLVYPGSDALAELARRVEAADPAELVERMRREGTDLCVIGEEAYLANGLADRCAAAGIRAWGPVREAARLESSKQFAKEFMARHHIPTAAVQTVSTPEAVRDAAQNLPCVLKFDGLAAGKGVSVCFAPDDVDAFIQTIFDEQRFGEGRVLVEEYLEGNELSIITAVSDGQVLPFIPARDYKRLRDDDQGPNTGGMGSIASRAMLPPETRERIEREIIEPTVRGLEQDGLPYRGFLYFGLMLTREGPKVLEYNCRFGDPETQAILPLVDGDLAAFLYEAAGGQLDPGALRFDDDWCVCVVLASGGYPFSSGKGERIDGLENVRNGLVIHAGTSRDEAGVYHVNGGRVLAVVCRGHNREEAVDAVYREVEKIRFDGMQVRTDIGRLHFEADTLRVWV